MVKIGDKVRFLSSVGGGIVVKQMNKELVLVREEDGFETPVLARECVVISTGDEKLKGASSKPVVVEQEYVADDPREAVMPIVETKEGDRLSIFLAYLPDDRRNLQQTTFDAYLVNDSNYYLFFTYLARNSSGQWKTRYAGMVEPNIKLHIESFGRDNLNDMERVAVQFVAFKKERDFALKTPVSVEHRIDTVKFYKLHSFRDNDFFDDDALIYTITKNDLPERGFDIDAQEIKRALHEKVVADKPQREPIVKRPKGMNQVIEVDLHIGQLLDSTAGMSNSDMLYVQLGRVREVLSEYKKQRGQKIVFIHGKGEGVLRNALLKELRDRYRTYAVQDASFREYGFGATMVTIK